MADENELKRLELKLEWRKHTRPLWMRGVLLIMIIVLITLQFINIRPLIALIALIVGYFMLPTSYSEDEPYNKVLSWLRLYIGFQIAMLLWLVFNPPVNMWEFVFSPFILLRFITSLTSPGPAVSIVLLTIAFFCTLPKAESVAGQPIVNIIQGAKGIRKVVAAAAHETAGNVLFLVLSITAVALLLPTILALQTLALIAGLIMGLGIFMGLFAGREGRPFIGILVIGAAMLAFSFSFTGLVGSTIFGGWWPQVQAGLVAVTAPMGEAFGSVTSGLDDARLLLTDPSSYYAKKEKEREQANTHVTEGGTTKSIELTEFTAINYAEGVTELNPAIPLIGSVQLENQGTFTARGINVSLDTLGICNPEEYSAARPEECWTDVDDKCSFTTCTGTDPYTLKSGWTNDGCGWPGNSLPGDIKLMLFKCAGTAGWTDEDVNLTYYDTDAQMYVYNHSGWQVRIPFDYSFAYTANVSLPIEVMNTTLFQTKLLNKEITLFNGESRYSGGPVKVSLFVQKQPLRDNEPSFGRISISNTGKGNVTAASVRLRLPNNGFAGVGTGPRLRDGSTGESVGENCPDNAGYTCHNLAFSNIAPGASASWTFEFTYDIDITLDKKSLAFAGTVDYNYTTRESITLAITRFAT